MRYRLQRHDGTDCSATMVPITVLRMVPIQRYRQLCIMKKIGYARVSTRDQNLDMQLHALKEAGCEQIFTEKKSGRKMDRPILKKLIKQSSAGDTIIVWKIDRIGRSAKDLAEFNLQMQQNSD